MPVLICCYQTPESWVSSIAAILRQAGVEPDQFLGV